MTSANTARKTVLLPRDPGAPVNRLISIKDIQIPSDLVEQATDRYLTTVRRSMPEFTVAEWCLIFDALRPPWHADESHTTQLPHEIADAIAIDQLDNKWPIDAANLRADSTASPSPAAWPSVKWWRPSGRNRPKGTTNRS